METEIFKVSVCDSFGQIKKKYIESLENGSIKRYDKQQK